MECSAPIVYVFWEIGVTQMSSPNPCFGSVRWLRQSDQSAPNLKSIGCVQSLTHYIHRRLRTVLYEKRIHRLGQQILFRGLHSIIQGILTFPKLFQHFRVFGVNSGTPCYEHMFKLFPSFSFTIPNLRLWDVARVNQFCHFYPSWLCAACLCLLSLGKLCCLLCQRLCPLR